MVFDFRYFTRTWDTPLNRITPYLKSLNRDKSCKINFKSNTKTVISFACQLKTAALTLIWVFTNFWAYRMDFDCFQCFISQQYLTALEADFDCPDCGRHWRVPRDPPPKPSSSFKGLASVNCKSNRVNFSIKMILRIWAFDSYNFF